MKRTEKKLKSKFGHSCKFHWVETCRWLMKYDRKYVAHHFGDARHLPFSRGNSGDYHACWFSCKMENYIERFLLKHVGMDADMVFHQFSKLGWRNTRDMYKMWRRHVAPWYRFYVSEEGILKDGWHGDDAVEQPEESEESLITEKLTPSQMLHNSKVEVPSIKCCEHMLRNGIYAGRMGKFYVEYEGRVILCQVYHVVCRDSRQWSLVEKDYSKVSILGSRRNMRWFHDCIWYGCNENLDDVKYYNGWVRYHDLRPMVRIEEVRSQLKKAA